MIASVLNHERRSRLLEFIRVRRFAAIEEIVREFGVSESTARRDLDALEERAATQRTHGGVLYAGGQPVEAAVTRRRSGRNPGGRDGR